ncbi:MAG: molybdopterin-dependent oxidoreductase, partial [Gammaproteobacteria bacterium]|nr:molybdopterin-dependent oxidoreductase [Gammaproteobacteria bacterium]
QNGKWQQVGWETALQTAIDGLKKIKADYGAEKIAGLISPSATLEEAYLFQKLLRGLGSNNIDHRLRQQDFSDQNCDYDHEEWSLADIEQSDDIVLVGCNIRAEQPIIAHRVRQSVMAGATVTDINFFASDLLMSVDKQVTVNAKEMLTTLSGIAKALIPLARDEDATAWNDYLDDVVPSAIEQTIAMQLSNATQGMLFVGSLAVTHPQAATIKALTNLIAKLSHSRLIVLPTANSMASAIASALPYVSTAQQSANSVGLDAQQSWQQTLPSYVLFGVEPELDCANPVLAQQSLQQASFVVSMNSYVSDTMLTYADVILPIASFAETSGTFIGVDGQWQSFTGAVTAKGESRPGWKVLRVLANVAKLNDFDYVSSQDVRDDVQDQIKATQAIDKASYIPTKQNVDVALMVISEVPMYQSDSVVRRSSALQQTPNNQRASIARMNADEAERYGVKEERYITVTQADNAITVPFEIDNTIADGCIYIAAGTQKTSHLGSAFGSVSVEPTGQGE